VRGREECWIWGCFILSCIFVESVFESYESGMYALWYGILGGGSVGCFWVGSFRRQELSNERCVKWC